MFHIYLKRMHILLLWVWYFKMSIWSSCWSVQFSRSVLSDSLWPHELQHARPPSPTPSITNSWSSLILTSIKSVMPSSHLIFCRPLLLMPPVPPRLIMQWSPSYHVLITWLIMHWSSNWSCTDHVADHALITWLIIHWLRDWSCTDHVTDHARITWLSCTDHLAGHTLITCLVMHRLHDWSCTDHVTDHSLITWLSCTTHVADHAMIM